MTPAAIPAAVTPAPVIPVTGDVRVRHHPSKAGGKLPAVVGVFHFGCVACAYRVVWR